jgi:nanoRNase/pAp phosphatase (c-di-AMP/oligoRNAs hydrolase)
VTGVFHSQIGNALSLKSGTFALMWSVDRQGEVKIGLRSQPGFDCIPLAESFGGGGHAQACGMRLPLQRLPELLAGALQAD